MLRLFGQATIENAGECCSITSRKQQLLFAYLAIHPAPSHRRIVSDALWKDGERNLRHLLWKINKQGAFIVADKESLSLNVDSDVAALREWRGTYQGGASAEKLLDLYRGKLLESFSPSLDRLWLEYARQRMQRLFLDNAYALAHQAAQHDDWVVALQLAKRAVEVNPHDDRFQQLLFASAFHLKDSQLLWSMRHSTSSNVSRLAHKATRTQTFSVHLLPPAYKRTADTSHILKPMSSESALELTLLGCFAAKRGNELSIRSTKQMALLSYLALNDLSIERQRLANLLWPNSTDAAAAKGLRNMLWSLRSTADGELFITESGSLTLLDTTKTDVRDFEKVARGVVQKQNDRDGQQVLDLYGGSLLTGWLSADLTKFEQWLTVERRRLERIAIGSMEMLTRISALKGEWSRVIEVATRMLMFDPYNEAGYRSIMLAHAKRGVPSRALSLYDQMCQRLADDLAVAPTPETVRLHRAIVAEESVQPTDIWQPLPVRARAVAFKESHVPLALYEREQFLEANISEATVPQTLIINGAFGVGKTRLLDTIAKRTTQLTLSVRIAQLDTAIPLQPLADALRHIMPLLSDLDDSTRRALGRWLPEYKEDEEVSRYAHPFEPIVQAFVHVAPLHLHIDDLHLADEDTKRAIAYLAERFDELQTPNTLVITQTLTGNEWSPSSLSTAKTITLQPLSMQTVASIVQGRTRGDTTLAQAWFDTSDGNPFWIDKLARGEKHLTTLAGYVRHYLESVSAEATSWLFATAILAEHAAVDRISTLLGLDELKGLKLLSEAMESGWLAAEKQDQLLGERTYVFIHNAVRQQVLKLLNPDQKKIFHRRAYQIAHNDDLPQETRAHHARGAGEMKRAFDHLLKAVAVAQERLAEKSVDRLLASAESMSALPDALDWISAEQEAKLRELRRQVGDATG